MTLLITDGVDIAINPTTGDIAIGSNGGPYLSTGLTGVVQAVRIALQLFVGEWFLNLDAGMPWYPNAAANVSGILGQKMNKTTTVVVRAAITNAILAVNGVTSLLQLALAWDANTRTLTITWQAQCTFGNTPVDTLSITQPTGGN
jgi:hypothetical protein